MLPLAEYILLGATLLLLCAAAWTDLRSRTIPNILPAAIFCLALAACVLFPEMRTDLGWRGLSLASMLVVGLAAFGSGALGGGDVKLLIALSPWFTLLGLPKFLLLVGVAGGILAVVFVLIAVAQRRTWKDAMREKVPYGVAILAGALIVPAI